jgi:release factor glutamine methyltransferase
VKTASDLVAWAKQLSLPLSESRALISHAIGQPKEWLIAHDQDILSAEQSQRCKAILQKRAVGEPFAYLVGYQEFYGRQFQVSPAVLIPRPDTELLIDAILETYPKNERLQVIDLGTGSGCIAITLALERPSWQVLATDISPSAIDVAINNAKQLGAGNIRFEVSSWWQNIQEQRFDIVASNPPYIQKNDTHLTQGDLRFEPSNALSDHADGLSAYKDILSVIAKYSMNETRVFLEHGYDQASKVADLVLANGLTIIEQKKDFAHQPRLMIARI